MALCIKPPRFSIASWTPPKGQGAREEGADHFLGLQGANWLVRHLEGWTQPLSWVAYSSFLGPLPAACRVWLGGTYSFSGHSRSQWTPFSWNLWCASHWQTGTDGWPRAEETRGPLGHSPKPLPALQPCFAMRAPDPQQAESQGTGDLGSPLPKKPEPCHFWLPSRTLGGMSAPAPMILAQPLAYPPIPQQASALSWGTPLGQRQCFILRIRTHILVASLTEL